MAEDMVFEKRTNVVRFPTGHIVRPLMERVRDAEPDVRHVLSAADSLGLAMPPPDLRDRADAETARHIAEHVLPLALAERRVALDGLLAPVAAAALRACADAARASRRCAAAVRDLDQARREGGHWLDPLEERAEALSLEAGRLLVAAYGRCQEAHGVARAAGLARRGEAWTPRGAGTMAAWLTGNGAA